FFGAFPFGDIGRDAAQPDEPAALVEACRRRPGAPAHLTVRPQRPEFSLESIGIPGDLPEGTHQQLEILWIDERLHGLQRRHKGVGVDAEYLALAVIPDRGTARDVPFPAAHLACCEREATQAFALAELKRG